MHDLLLYHALRMALEADLGYGILEHTLVGRLVGVMAGGAVISHDGCVNHFFLVLWLMAHVAERSARLYQGYGQIARMFCFFPRLLNCLMAGGAHALFYRIMHHFVLGHTGMALAGGA